MIEMPCTQGEPDWFAARRGVITATRAADLLRRTSRGWAASRAKMVAKIAMERIDSAPRDAVTSRTMARGHELEPEAIGTYEFERGVSVRRVGLVLHDDFPQFGCSPDGLVGEDGGVEVKCPDAPDKMADYLLNGAHVAEYEGQVRHCLYITGRKWWHVVAFDPRTPNGWNLAIGEVFAPECWAEYEADLLEVDAEINAMVARLHDVRGAA